MTATTTSASDIGRTRYTSSTTTSATNTTTTRTAIATATSISALVRITSKQFEMEVREGLAFILNHLDDLWPKTISTYATKGVQIPVKDFEEAMAWFKASNFLDSEISAYPKYTKDYINSTGVAPTVLHIDIDKRDKQFKTPEEFELAAARTYTNFHNILGSRPTQLWTGGGYHFLTPQRMYIIEKVEEFSKFNQPSRRFMHFEEQLLTDCRADQNHWNSVSFSNCMLRVPFSLNSKYIQFDGGRIVDTEIPYDARVRIVNRWDGNTPIIDRDLLLQYRIWLQFAAIREIREQRIREEQYRKGKGKYRRGQNNHNYNYIEKLLDKPLTDFRKYCIWRIFVPYFINVKGLSRLETFDKVNSWLDKCDSISRLNFSAKQKIDYELEEVANYTPIRADQLGAKHNRLWSRLQNEGVV
jgi:hypothetical protein